MTPGIDALIEAAESGVDFDGLRVERRDGGYLFETPGTRAAGLDEAGLREAATGAEAFVSNWKYWTRTVDATGARYAYLRWLEGAGERGVEARYGDLASGMRRSWGQLAVTVELGDDGERRYGVRHEDDAGADAESLERHVDPLDMREIARFDDRGRYRPLKTAPSLATGWTFEDLEPGELIDVVGCCYPATVENWHREREGDLDVTHWREAAERQTGIYDVADELPDEAVTWAAEACCVDSQCLKRRAWDRAENDPIDVERGEGAFPCREPCSLLIAATREWALLEREEPRTYEFELTESEREQVEAIIDAVADGRTDEIREAALDDAANRYRARYLRAKRFDEDGRLGRER